MSPTYNVIRPGRVHELRNLTGTLVTCPECDSGITITGEVQKTKEKSGFLVDNMYSNAFFEILVLDAAAGHFQMSCKECGCVFKVESDKE